jgi:hypothetical protein
MALRHLSTVLCDYVIVSNEGKASAIGLFQNIRVTGFPGAVPMVGIIVTFAGERGDPYEVRLEGPGMEDMVVSQGVCEPPPGLDEHQQWGVMVYGKAAPMVFNEPGVYRVVLRCEAEVVHSYPFGVFVQRTEEAATDGQR